MRMAPSRRAYRLISTLSRLLATTRKLNPDRNKAMARRHAAAQLWYRRPP